MVFLVGIYLVTLISKAEYVKKLARAFYKGRMLLLAPLFGLVFALAFILPAFASTVTQDVPFTSIDENNCTNPPENLTFVGTVHIVDTINSNPSGGVLVHTLISYRAKGTSDTGTIYTLTSPNNSVDNNVKAGQEFTIVESQHLISQGKTLNQIFSLLVHQTINANGTVTVSIDNETIRCS